MSEASVPSNPLAGSAFSPRRGEADDIADVAAQVRRWYWQRISAMVLALCVVVHLAVMIYAVRGGLSGAEILARTRGSAFGPPRSGSALDGGAGRPHGFSSPRTAALATRRFRPAMPSVGAMCFGQRSVHDPCVWHAWQPASPATARSRSVCCTSRTSLTSVHDRFNAAGPRNSGRQATTSHDA